MDAFRDDATSVSNSEYLKVEEVGPPYPARDVKPTVGLMPTNAFLSAGLMTTQRDLR